MQETIINFDEMRVEKFKKGEKNLDLIFAYTIDGTQIKINRTFNLDDNVVNFISSILNEIRKVKMG